MFQEFVLEHPQIEHFETPVSDSELLPQGIKLSVLSWVPNIRGRALCIVHWQQSGEGKEECVCNKKARFEKQLVDLCTAATLGVFISWKKRDVTTQ